MGGWSPGGHSGEAQRRGRRAEEAQLKAQTQFGTSIHLAQRLSFAMELRKGPKKRKRSAAEEINDKAQGPIESFFHPAEQIREPKEPTEVPMGQADQVEKRVERIEASTSYSESSTCTLPRWPPAGHEYGWDDEDSQAGNDCLF